MKYRYIALATLLLISGGGVWLCVHSTTPPPEPPQENKPLAPDKLRLQLVETLKKESLADTIKNLPNYDDCVYTSGSIEGIQGYYEFSRIYVPRLNRVKRIWEQRKSDPMLIERTLREKLATSTKAFPKAFREELDKLRKEGGFSASEPSEHDICLTFGGACTYLLAELGSHKSLPMMSQIMGRKSAIPVNRIFLFYAMHRLVMTHPKDLLSADAKKALEAYMKSTEWVPPPNRVKVASGLALVDEADLRARHLGKDVGLDKEPQIEMVIYPSMPMIDDDPRYFSKRVAKLEEPIALMRTFIELAYPEMKKPAETKKNP
jgi:hypothetical protein